MRQPPRIHAAEPSFIRASLLRRERLSATMVRVTLGGDALQALPVVGADQFFRLFFPREAGQELRLPASASLWYPRLLAIPERARPHVRAYTVRRRRPEAGELDLDVVVHEGATGPGMRWALDAPEGGACALLDSGRLFNPPSGGSPMLLAGDQTALPGIAAICEGLDADAAGAVVLALDEAAAADQLSTPPGLSVRLVERPEDLPAAAAEAWGEGFGYAYCCAEQAAAAGMRRALVKDLGVSAEVVTFAGFWRRGRAAT